MEYRYLGNSGLKISSLIYGNWLTHSSQIDDKTASKCVSKALDLGITSFDTADTYANTRAEKLLGRLLRDSRRQSLEIFTKVYFPTGDQKHNDTGLSRKHIMESIHGSLTRLRTDYVDLYQAHRYDYETPLEETMLAFADIVRQGKALYIGVSEWNASQVAAGAKLAKELQIPFISNQVEYSMLYRVAETQIVPACETNGMGLIAFSPLAQGVLTGKYRPGGKNAPAKSRAGTKDGANMMKQWMNKSVLSRVQGLRRIAEESGCSMTHLALAWLLKQRAVSGAIIGASDPKQIEDNVKALKVKLPKHIEKIVDEALADVIISDPRETTNRTPKTRLC